MTSTSVTAALDVHRHRHGLVAPATEVVWQPTLEFAYRQFAPAVLGYYRSHGMRNPEDLVGDVFVSVSRNLGRFQGDAEDLRRWVFAIARRRRVDHIRRLFVRRRVASVDPPERGVTDRTDGLDIDLVAALRGLTAAQRDVVVLRFVADLSLEDVAQILRRSTGAVKALQARALANLAVLLGPSRA